MYVCMYVYPSGLQYGAALKTSLLTNGIKQQTTPPIFSLETISNNVNIMKM